MDATSPGAELLSIGSELLLGETVDTNAAFLGAELARLGLPLRQSRALPDDRFAISQAFAEARPRSAVVVATGGLGPTHDDLTRDGLADALGETLEEDARLRRALEDRFQAYGRMPASNLRQAMVVPSAQALENPIGSAPGWWVERDGGVTVLLPGVPAEMRRMWAEQVAPRLATRFGLPPLAIRVVKAFGIGESAAAERLGGILESPPDGVEAGIYARDDGIHVRLSTRDDPAVLDRPVGVTLAALGDDAYGTDDADLAAVALAALGTAGIRTLASVESGTNGALLSALASVVLSPLPGSAARFVGGVLQVDGDPPAPPSADVLLLLRLLPEDGHGRSRVEVALSGMIERAPARVRIHGSGQQRMRRAAFAALDQVRRSLSPSDR